MIVDAHTHVWPDRIARAALAKPADDLTRCGDGTVAGSIAAMREAGIDRSVAFGISNDAEHRDAANRFVASLDREWFIPFGTIHTDASVEENIENLRKHDIHAVKLHPLFQGIALDDPRLWENLEAMQGEFVITTHVGLGGEGAERCTPRMLRDLVERFPDLDLIAAHFGGYRRLDEVEELIVGLPVCVDTSWPPGLASIDPDRLRGIIERHGADRVIFASDWPMSSPAENLAALRALELPAEQAEAILSGNLLGLLAKVGAPVA
ncbi:MAG: amidohydrolase family protein [Solirubrobacterales bacterium]